MDSSYIASLISLGGLVLGFFSYMKDKMRSAEAMGQLREKVRSLEESQVANAAKFATIDQKLDKINQCLGRVETLIQTLSN
jgi:Tfp pilus assembly protein PilO